MGRDGVMVETEQDRGMGGGGGIRGAVHNFTQTVRKFTLYGAPGGPLGAGTAVLFFCFCFYCGKNT